MGRFRQNRMLVQLIYTSRLIIDTHDEHGWSRLMDIVTAARERNRHHAISSFMLIGDSEVAQILEGERDAVLATFRRILSDPRHSALTLIDMRMTQTRHFGEDPLAITRVTGGAIPALIAVTNNRPQMAFNAILALARAKAA